MASLLLLAVTLFTVIGVALTVAALVRGRRRQARARGTTVLAVVVLYGVALAAVGLTSRERHLAYGQAKCFDDWCVTVQSIVRVPGQEGRLVTVVVTSRARRVAQRPDSPAAYLVTDSGRARIALPGLDQRLAPGQSVDLRLAVAVPASARDPQFLITEGGFPCRLVVGDENSPWHAAATWAL